jgi:hypothetical protein
MLSQVEVYCSAQRNLTTTPYGPIYPAHTFGGPHCIVIQLSFKRPYFFFVYFETLYCGSTSVITIFRLITILQYHNILNDPSSLPSCGPRSLRPLWPACPPPCFSQFEKSDTLLSLLGEAVLGKPITPKLKGYFVRYICQKWIEFLCIHNHH